MLRNSKRPHSSVSAEEYLQAANSGDMDIIQRYLEQNSKNPDAVNVRNSDGETAATLAAFKSHTEAVVELLAAGCKVDRRAQLIEDARSDGDEETARILNDYQIRMNFIKRLIDEFKLALSKEMIRHILTMSVKRYVMLADKTAFLIMYAMLTYDTFNDELAKTLLKYPRVEMTAVEEIKNLHPHKTEYKILSGGSFFTDKRPRDYSGTYGIVNTALRNKDDLRPSFGVKWFRRQNANHQTPSKEALRETKYNIYFTRREPAILFEVRGRTGMRYAWQDGDQLEKCTAAEFMRQSPEVRVQCAMTFIDEMNYMHMHERCHRDLGFSNVLISFTARRMYIIDFGSARKVGRLFDDEFNYSKDMYDLSKIIRKLFPEIKKKIKFIHLEAMKYLDQALSPKNSQYVCTSAQAFAYCQAVMELPVCKLGDDNWNAVLTKLKDIADKTINSPILTAENLRRGSVRAATFQYKL